MKINKNNYEAFFLDFAEGRLDNSSTLELLSFLRNNPGLKNELESFNDLRLDASEESFPGKEFLKKMDFGHALVNPNNFDDFCIAWHEKILSKTEEQKLLAYFEQHPEKKKDFELFGKTTLVANSNVVFEAKPFLKKKPKGAALRTVVLRFTAVAAGLLLAVTIYYKSTVKNETQNRITVAKTIVTKHINEKKPAQLTNPENTVNEVASLSKTYTHEVRVSATRSSQTGRTGSQKDKVVPMEVPVQQDLTMLASRGISSIANTPQERPQLRSTGNNTLNEAEETDDLELFAYAQKLIQTKVLKQDENSPKKKISLWDLADATIKGYNSITENDLKLHRETDENGKVTAIAIETESKKYGFSNKN